MPRIRPAEILRARVLDKTLPSLLPVCRDVASARNELRWLQEHATLVSRHAEAGSHHALLRSFVARRACGEPLQYILGSEYFGDLEIRCRPGVLIPRQETAASVSHLVSLLRKYYDSGRKLRVLDLCTGSGCIPLLFHDEYYKADQNAMLELVGIDISTEALSLARENLLHQIAKSSQRDSIRARSLNHIGFVQADVLRDDESADPDDHLPLPLERALQRLYDGSDQPKFDILISNPPYVSPTSFNTTTARSVRDFEPRLALVPPQPTNLPEIDTGDLFYPKLLKAAKQINAKVILFEVADMEQAKRVGSLVHEQGVFDHIEVWRDEANLAGPDASETIAIGNRTVRIRGRGNGRSIFAWRDCAGMTLLDQEQQSR